MANILQKFMGSSPVAPIGDNKPPSDLEILQERITENNKEILDSAAKLVADSETMPEVIENDKQSGEVTDLIKELRGAWKKLESTRVAEKEPYLALTRAVDGFFNVPKDDVEKAAAKLKKPLDAWLKKQADEARIAREAEAKRLREESQRQIEEAAAIAAASPKAADVGMVNAAVTQQRAEHVERSISAPASSMAQSRGTGGGVAGLRTRWVGTIKSRQELDLNQLRPYFTEDSLQKALNAAVTAGIRNITGADIIQTTDTVVR